MDPFTHTNTMKSIYTHMRPGAAAFHPVPIGGTVIGMEQPSRSGMRLCKYLQVSLWAHADACMHVSVSTQDWLFSTLPQLEAVDEVERPPPKPASISKGGADVWINGTGMLDWVSCECSAAVYTIEPRCSTTLPIYYSAAMPRCSTTLPYYYSAVVPSFFSSSASLQHNLT